MNLVPAAIVVASIAGIASGASHRAHLEARDVPAVPAADSNCDSAAWRSQHTADSLRVTPPTVWHMLTVPPGLARKLAAHRLDLQIPVLPDGMPDTIDLPSPAVIKPWNRADYVHWIARWRFGAARLDGCPVPGTVRITVWR